MLTISSEIELNTEALKNTNLDFEDILFFDIETTGFDANHSILYLIGCIYFQQNSWFSTQFFGKTADDEKEILDAFISLCKKHKALICYNGAGFDIPYIEKKCQKLSLEYDFNNHIIIDIYKSINPIRALFNTENLKQRTIEHFLGIMREDKYSGGELINYFHKYQKNNSKEIFNMLILHNKEDIIGMTNVLPMLSYESAISGDFYIDSVSSKELPLADGTLGQEIIITALLTKPVPKRVSYSFSSFNIVIYKDRLTLTVKAYTKELKYFYPNYKDYFYMPLEDVAIHKSVAFYVDKNFRTKAKAANCYSKKTGVFLPQFEEVVCPYFKIDYYDKTLFFEYTEEFKADNELIKKYLLHILSNIIR